MLDLILLSLTTLAFILHSISRWDSRGEVLVIHEAFSILLALAMYVLGATGATVGYGIGMMISLYVAVRLIHEIFTGNQLQ